MTYDAFKTTSPKDIIKRIKKKNVVLIINKRLSPKEEAELIEVSMAYVDGVNFKGIEIATISTHSNKTANFISNIMRIFKSDAEGITLIGNATHIKEIKNKKDYAVLKL